nr:two-component sensor histidine kinase [Thauera phenylacetica]
MRLPLPPSLFARLMLIWLVGIALVLAVSLALFLGERERIGRSALFEGVAQEIASVADLLDSMSPPERARWIDEIGRRRLRLALRPPHDHLRPLAEDHPLHAALREAMPQRPATLYTHPRDDRPHPGLAIVLALADGTPLQVRLPGIPPAPPIMPHQRGPFLAALAALVLGVGLLTWIAVRIATRPLS